MIRDIRSLSVRKPIVPLYDFEIPILADDTVAMDKGTGVVMCASFGDSADVEWYQKHKLTSKEVILADGTISEKIDFIGKMTVKRPERISLNY